MELIVFVLPLGIAGAALGRWTRLHPLVVGAVIGLLPAALAR